MSPEMGKTPGGLDLDLCRNLHVVLARSKPAWPCSQSQQGRPCDVLSAGVSVSADTPDACIGLRCSPSALSLLWHPAACGA